MGAPLILVVDDDPDIRMAIADALEGEGYQVELASNGTKALEILKSGRRPSAVMLDLMMPYGDGEFLLKAKNSEKDLAGIPVILLSAESKLDQRARQSGVHFVLKKPVGLMDLLKTLKGACDSGFSAANARAKGVDRR